MPPARSSEVARFDQPVMRHVRRDFLRVLAHQTVGEALEYVRTQPPGSRIVYFYVVDEEDRLLGVLPTRALLLSQPAVPIAEIMIRDVITLPESATLLDACEFFLLHRLLAFPVVDGQGRMQGVVDVELYTDEVSELGRLEESEDIFQLIGVRLAEVQKASAPAVFARRFPWLLCNIGGGLLCALVASQFTGVLNAVIALSLFIPVVLAIAESVSIQTLSLALQSHHGNRFRWRDSLRQLRREVPVGAMLGGACGFLVAAAALGMQGIVLLAVSVFTGILLSVISAAVLGLVIPTLLHVARRDPQVASGPIVLALTDVGTMVFYLGAAHLLLM